MPASEGSHDRPSVEQHFTWDGRIPGLEQCRLLTSDLGSTSSEGFTSGFTSAFRAVADDAYPLFSRYFPESNTFGAYCNRLIQGVGLGCPHLIANTSNGYTVQYGVSLGTKPMHGAVWLDVSIVQNSGVDMLVKIVPPRLVFYGETWNVTQLVTVRVTLLTDVTLLNVTSPDASGASGDSLRVIVAVQHMATACDNAFTLNPQIRTLSDIPLQIDPAVSEDVVEYAISTGAVVAIILTVVLVVLIVLYLLRRNRKRSSVFLLQATGSVPELSLASEMKYHG